MNTTHTVEYDSDSGEVPRGVDVHGNLIPPEKANKDNKYSCPHCEQILTLCAGKKIRTYFRHNVKNSHCSNEDVLHATAKKMLFKAIAHSIADNSDTISFVIPCSDKSCTCNGTITHKLPEKANQPAIEHKDKAQQLGYDISLSRNDKLAMVFEVYNTSKVSSKKIDKLNVPWVEIKAEEIIEKIVSFEKGDSTGICLSACKGSIKHGSLWICPECTTKIVDEAYAIQREKDEAENQRLLKLAKIRKVRAYIREAIESLMASHGTLTMIRRCSVDGCSGVNEYSIPTQEIQSLKDDVNELHLSINMKDGFEVGVLISKPGIHSGMVVESNVPINVNWVEIDWDRRVQANGKLLIERARGVPFTTKCNTCEQSKIASLEKQISSELEKLKSRLLTIPPGSDAWITAKEGCKETVLEQILQVNIKEFDGLLPLDHATLRVNKIEEEVVSALKIAKVKAIKPNQDTSHRHSALDNTVIDNLFLSFENDLYNTADNESWTAVIKKYKDKFDDLVSGSGGPTSEEVSLSLSKLTNEVIAKVKRGVKRRQSRDAKKDYKNILKTLPNLLMEHPPRSEKWKVIMQSTTDKIMKLVSLPDVASKADAEQKLSAIELQVAIELKRTESQKTHAEIQHIIQGLKKRLFTLIIDSETWTISLNDAIVRLTGLYATLKETDPETKARSIVNVIQDEARVLINQNEMQDTLDASLLIVESAIGRFHKSGRGLDVFNDYHIEAMDKIEAILTEVPLPEDKANHVLSLCQDEFSKRLVGEVSTYYFDSVLETIIRLWKSSSHANVNHEIITLLRDLDTSLSEIFLSVQHPVVDLLAAYNADRDSEGSMLRILSIFN